MPVFSNYKVKIQIRLLSHKGTLQAVPAKEHFNENYYEHGPPEDSYLQLHIWIRSMFSNDYFKIEITDGAVFLPTKSAPL